MPIRFPTISESIVGLCPAVAAQWHPHKNGDRRPEHYVPGSNVKVWWLGPCGHEWDAPIYGRTGGAGCPVCRGLRILIGFNDLATTERALAKQWHPSLNGVLTAHDVTRGSSRKVWWLGACGHEWQAAVRNRACAGNGCPYCSGVLLLRGFNDLATTHPGVAAQWHPTRNGDLTPSDVKHGSKKMVWWTSTCAHVWDATVNERTNRMAGCPFCSGHRVLIGFNDLATTHPELAVQWHPSRNTALSPTAISAGTRATAWWLCPEGHEWKASVKNRASNGAGCPTCAREAGHHSSLAERNLRASLADMYTGTAPDEVHLPRREAGKIWKCDIVIALMDGQSVVVEFDGHPSHARPEKVAFDRNKSDALRALGHVVIRVRPSSPARPLGLLHEHDLHVTHRQAHHSNAQWVAEQVAARLTELGFPPDQSPVEVAA